jgi:hypothetical protein
MPTRKLTMLDIPKDIYYVIREYLDFNINNLLESNKELYNYKI